MDITEESIVVRSSILPIVCGIQDTILRYLEQKFSVSITVGDEKFLIKGNEEQVFQVSNVIHQLIMIAKNQKYIGMNDAKLLVEQSLEEYLLEVSDKNKHGLKIEKIGKKIEPKTSNQIKYFNALKDNDLVISYGPAGTGKTYLAVSYALQQLLMHKYKKIVLTRPVVEAGEKLGFLPGDFVEKVNPYVQPLYDAIFDIVGPKMYEYLKHSESIEIVPLAYMRGRTLNDAIIILDEAQNTTISQIKMFLTRFGYNSKVIVTGDITQIDLEEKSKSGLEVIINILSKFEEIAIIEFEKKDVVRHPLVKKIIKAFDDYEKT